ncbi:serine/threonine-protein kinase [Nostoc sp. FACHB-110]|uniref:serine/threonine protein kinase n=1 Tax=Nostoc sp. FACHB-110 TaxID=2692834 RepID=UPI001684A730|nr:serine/threonine-protein kinase [Nostoc sp. FACHB-110]MBD2439784.1 serine/threonine protein kinase [Nostoc sp. FACHB-110]
MLETQQILCDCYQLEQKLSETAGRQTWLAKDLSRQEKVVIKLLCFNDQVHWENVRLFEREGKVLKELQHPQIPKYQNYFCVEEQLLWFGLVQEYIPAWSLKELLVQGKIFTEVEARKVAKEVLNILVYLHGLSPPVIHRDIKPSNLLLSEDGQIYLIDFGAVQDNAAKAGATFTVVGTYGYAPLEQFGGRASAASDIYALGATLIHLLTGIAPADLPNLDSRLRFAHLVNLNPGFVRWLEQMTQPNLEKRFSSAEEALAVLEENEQAISIIVNSQLPSDRIKLKKTLSQLQIKISALETTGKPVMFRIWPCSLGITLIVLGFYNSFAWYLFMIMCFASLKSTINILLETQINFDKRYFEIELKILGITFSKQRGKVLDIDKIFVSKNELVLSVGVREYSTGWLRDTEYLWLIAEIKQWLGLK